MSFAICRRKKSTIPEFLNRGKKKPFMEAHVASPARFSKNIETAG
jgi:hypothetical protein